MQGASTKKPIFIFLLNLIALIIAYYVSLLLHEWGHGAVAWLYGVKHSPFDVTYGGWFLKNADENVNYDALFDSGRGVTGALIGIAGPVVSFLFVIISFILLNRKSFYRDATKLIFAYWFLVMNMLPMMQYLTVSTFSSGGDTGHFAHGLNISSWWIFLPGTVFIIFAMWRILKIEIIKAYVVMPIKSITGQNILLLITLGIIFLFIYTHGYNPFTDKGLDSFSRVMAILSIVLAPVLFIVCNPMRDWVQRAILKQVS